MQHTSHSSPLGAMTRFNPDEMWKKRSPSLETGENHSRCPFHKYTASADASRHSRASGNPGGEGHGDWMPSYAGMTFYWYQTYEMDI